MENSESFVSQMSPGDMVRHPLGFDAMVSNIFDSVKHNETGETQKLPHAVLEVEYLDKNGVVQHTRIIENLVTKL